MDDTHCQDKRYLMNSLKKGSLQPGMFIGSCGVHVVSVYNVANGVPVLPIHEAAIREGLYRVTGERYTAFIHTTQPDFSANY